MEDIKLRWLSEKSYWVEKKRTDVDYHPEKEKKYFYDDKNQNLERFQVLHVI